LDPIPETWPPSPEEGGPKKRIVPLFPMPRLWLFPYVVLPLLIVEERYRQMIEDSLDGPGRIVLGTVRAGFEEKLEGSPPVYPLAGLGEIGRHNRMENGDFQVLLFGLQRVHLNEVESDRAYRKVEVQPVIEIPIRSDREAPLREKLIKAILARTDKLTSIPPQIPTSHLADLLTLRMPLPPDAMHDLYGELDIEKRSLGALEEHKVRPDLEDDESAGEGGADAPDLSLE